MTASEIVLVFVMGCLISFFASIVGLGPIWAAFLSGAAPALLFLIMSSILKDGP